MAQPSGMAELSTGFADPVRDSQRTFRAILDAISYPGRILGLGQGPDCPALDRAQAAIALALVDFETPVWLDPAAGAAAPWLRFHCGCPIVEDPAATRFAFVVDAATMPPLAEFDAGSDEFPDRSATVVVRVDGLREGGDIRLFGPGIRDEIAIDVAGLHKDFWAGWADNGALFPCGIDVLLTADDRVVGLPRTTRVRS